MEQIELSILVPTVPSRFAGKCVTLINRLLAQAEGKPVEVLWFGDNKRRSVGAKRNDLLSLARGKYVAFIDDDDWVEDDYVGQILKLTPSNVDVICFDHRVMVDGKQPKLCYYSKDFSYETTATTWKGLPAHTMAWKREIAVRHKFPEINVGEDTGWVAKAVADVKTEAQVGKVLYHYHFQRKESETRVDSGPSKWEEARAKFMRRRQMSMPDKTPKCSIVMSTYNKPTLLARTLDSIVRQKPTFSYEVIVVDDGSPTEDAREICRSRCVTYHRLDRAPEYRNPSVARNFGYKVASGDVVIAQSDDVVHDTEDAIERLVRGLFQGEFHIATVYDRKFTDSGVGVGSKRMYSGKEDGRPLFFLGSLWRSDIYAIGGNDERFTMPGYEDDFFGLCLLKRGLRAVYRDDVVGFHQSHDRPPLRTAYREMEALHTQLVQDCESSGSYVALGAPWNYQPGKSLFAECP